MNLNQLIDHLTIIRDDCAAGDVEVLVTSATTKPSFDVKPIEEVNFNYPEYGPLNTHVSIETGERLYV